ncbi:MAG: hypothetical protein ACLU4N_24655 [Butyricimonas faecihominis]
MDALSRKWGDNLYGYENSLMAHPAYPGKIEMTPSSRNLSSRSRGLVTNLSYKAMKDLQHSIKRIGKRVLIGSILLISVYILIYSLVFHYYLKAGVSQPPAQFIRKLADRLHIEDNNFKVDSLLLVQVKEQQIWVMLLDDKQRNIRWAVNLPGLLPDTTAGRHLTLAKSHLKNDSPAGCKETKMFAASDLKNNSQISTTCNKSRK